MSKQHYSGTTNLLDSSLLQAVQYIAFSLFHLTADYRSAYFYITGWFNVRLPTTVHRPNQGCEKPPVAIFALGDLL